MPYRTSRLHGRLNGRYEEIGLLIFRRSAAILSRRSGPADDIGTGQSGDIVDMQMVAGA
jgi:hypothetical protein